MSRPLIVHIVFRLTYGGLENGLVNLLNRLPADAGRHAVVCLTDYSEFRQRIRDPDVAVYALHKRPGKDLGVYLRLWRLLRRLRPALVHTRNTGVLDCQLVAWLAGVPVRVHGYHGWDVDDLHGRDPGRQAFRRRFDPLVTRYVAVSRQIARWMTGELGVAAGRIEQIHNGVDAARFAPGPPAPELVEAVGGGPGRLVVGTVGRLEAVKNQVLLVRAAAQARAAAPELAPALRLVLIGDGSQRAALEAEIRRLQLEDCCRILGFRDDVAELLRALDVFVLPSLNEGVSNTVLEAMSTGLPVIATAVGGNGELVVPEECGFLVAPDDPPALAAALVTYLGHPEVRARHAAAARDRVEREFSLQRMTDRYAMLYRDLLAAGARGRADA